MESRHELNPLRNEDFHESDVWDIMTKREAIAIDYEQPFVGLLSKQLQSAAKPILKATNPSQGTKLVQHSAPMNIPDWSKVYGKSPNESFSSNDDDDDDEDKVCRIPPHEWLARKRARNYTASFSVCEGVGRTLKGRDLRRVRDAVLTKTTFL